MHRGGTELGEQLFRDNSMVYSVQQAYMNPIEPLIVVGRACVTFASSVKDTEQTITLLYHSTMVKLAIAGGSGRECIFLRH